MLILVPKAAKAAIFVSDHISTIAVKKDISTLEDIRLLVDSFYDTVQKDTLIGGIFAGAIKEWPHHLAKMYNFWQTVLLEAYTYQGSPFPPHAQLPVRQEHFDRWLELWGHTLDTHFSGPKAEEAKWRAQKMAVMFLSKINYFREKGGRPLL